MKTILKAALFIGVICCLINAKMLFGTAPTLNSYHAAASSAMMGGGDDIPITQLQPEYCDVTVEAINYYLWCFAVPGANKYRFEISNDDGFIDSVGGYLTHNFMSLHFVEDISYNETYSIRVKARVNGEWGAYGPSCQVTTPAEVPATQLIDEQCNDTLLSLAGYIRADWVPGADKYRFRVEDPTEGFVDSIVGYQTYWFAQLWAMNGVDYNTTYEIQVRTRVDGVWGPYGPICELTTPATPPLTNLKEEYCNRGLVANNQYIFAEFVPGAQKYGFEVTDTASGEIDTLLGYSNQNLTALSWLPMVTSNKVYAIRVRTRIAGVWYDFGESCIVSTPFFVNVEDEYCGDTLESVLDPIYADYYEEVENYQFELTNVNTQQKIYAFGVDNANFIVPAAIPGIAPNTTYSIRVRSLVNGTWGPYKEACEVTTSLLHVTQLIDSDCGILLDELNQFLHAEIVPGADLYEFWVGNPPTGFSDTISGFPSPSIMSLIYLSDIRYGTDYGIRVRARLNGIWGEFGPLCTVSTPQIPETELISSDCGITLGSLNQYVNATIVPYADAYQFEVTNSDLAFADTVIGSPSPSILSFSSIPGIEYETTYQVRVRAGQNGTWGEFAAICEVTTPETPALPQVDLENEYFSENATSVNETEAKEFAFELFPNPTAGEVSIVLSEQVNAEFIDVRILNLHGQQVHQEVVKTSQNVGLQLNHLSDGFYIVQVFVGTSNVASKRLLVR